MRLQIIEPDAKFSCGSCGHCCDQPWRTAIEADKVAALDRHDFSNYPQLAGKKFYRPAADGRPGYFDLSKGVGTKCIFLDTDRMCIIHKELGAEAKPAMCRQFPLLSSRTWVDERVSLNYACPAVQRNDGAPLATQSEDIAQVVPLSGKPVQADARITLTGKITLSIKENDALLDSMAKRFEPGQAADIWNCFAECLSLVIAGGKDLSNPKSIGAIEPFDKPATAPLATRMLFAATLQPDTLPPDLSGRMGLLGRITLIPKMMSLANLNGIYASRVLGRNVTIQSVMSHAVAPELDAESTALLCRYVQSRIWQRTLMGTRLSVLGGLHQHIHDMNAVLFFARAEAAANNVSKLTLMHIRQGLACVEFHLANQTRVFSQVLKGWLRAKLDDPAVAFNSLRLFAPRATYATQERFR